MIVLRFIGPILGCANLITARTFPSHLLHRFERRYIDSQNYEFHNETVKLIGYKSISIPLHTKAEFAEQYNLHSTNADFDAFRSVFYDQDTATLRVYFPIADALVEHNGELLEANHLGEFDVDKIRGDYHVVGRRQTDTAHGHENNIIRDGVIYLAEKAAPSHRHGKVFVYDLGKRNLDDHDHAHHPRIHFEHSGLEGRGEDADGNNDSNGEQNEDVPTRGCVKNHGGINCSDAYQIYNGRCPFDKTTCMDYNGYFGGCRKDNRVMGFVGSDCFTSVSRGNCWNEMVGAEEDDENWD